MGVSVGNLDHDRHQVTYYLDCEGCDLASF
jgi:hypothetical protein